MHQGLSYSPIVKLLWLSESDKVAYSDCLVRRTDTSFTDQDVGSSVVMCHPEHLRIICVGVEADGCNLLGYTHVYKNGRQEASYYFQAKV